MSNEVVPYEQRIGALTVQDMRAQVNLIQHVMKEVMQGPSKDHPEGVHYGVIPGTPKPTLYKAGAEKLCLTFRLDPQYESTERFDGKHLFVKSKCTLYHIPSGQRFGSGEGSCSTLESKYAYRDSKRKCPKCGAEAIIKGKDFKGDGLPTGWICFGKKGGCGEKFKDGDESIEGQKIGRAANEDVADQYNTVLKMANKRSLVAAVLNTTAASDIFTQDVEDMQLETRPASQVPPEPAPSPSSSANAGGATSPRAATFKHLCEQAKVNMIDVLAKAGVAHADEMSNQDWTDCQAMLNRKITKRAKEVAGQA